MSLADDHEHQLYRDNMAEEIARALQVSSIELSAKYGLTPVRPWTELKENEQAFAKAMILDMIDRGVIAPWAVVNNLQMELSSIKQTWKVLNKQLGSS